MDVTKELQDRVDRHRLSIDDAIGVGDYETAEKRVLQLEGFLVMTPDLTRGPGSVVWSERIISFRKIILKLRSSTKPQTQKIEYVKAGL